MEKYREIGDNRKSWGKKRNKGIEVTGWGRAAVRKGIQRKGNSRTGEGDKISRIENKRKNRVINREKEKEKCIVSKKGGEPCLGMYPKEMKTF